MEDYELVSLMAALMAQGIDPKLEEDRREARARYYVNEALRFRREARRQCSALMKAGDSPAHSESIDTLSIDEVRELIRGIDLD